MKKKNSHKKKGVCLMQALRNLLLIFILAVVMGCGGGKSDEEYHYQYVPIGELAISPKEFPVGAKLEVIGFPEKITRNPFGHRDNLEWTEAFDSGHLFYLRGKEGGCCAILIRCKTDNILSPARVQGEWRKKMYGGGDTEIYYLEVDRSSLAKGQR